MGSEISIGTDSGGEQPLRENELRLANVKPGQIVMLCVEGEAVAVYNVNGVLYATQNRCAHIGYPLSDGGELDGAKVTCAMHGWCFDVTTGEVLRGVRTLKLRTYRVELDGQIARVLPG
ncbi:MAG TPA: Rieske 2Fe-2S domain-containing protein [Anaerolineae bacterium]|jgi:nitrite reductase/ring-hydroxylating ferredoxin subunit